MFDDFLQLPTVKLTPVIRLVNVPGSLYNPYTHKALIFDRNNTMYLLRELSDMFFAIGTTQREQTRFIRLQLSKLYEANRNSMDLLAQYIPYEVVHDVRESISVMYRTINGDLTEAARDNALNSMRDYMFDKIDPYFIPDIYIYD